MRDALDISSLMRATIDDARTYLGGPGIHITKLHQIAGPFFQQFPPMARDTAKQKHKEVTLTVAGEEMEIDKIIIDTLRGLAQLVKKSHNIVDLKKKDGGKGRLYDSRFFHEKSDESNRIGIHEGPETRRGKEAPYVQEKNQAQHSV